MWISLPFGPITPSVQRLDAAGAVVPPSSLLIDLA
jgi:hypothetical protein